MVKLILTRHGESVANVEQVFANVVDDQFPLTRKGEMQAEKLARDLSGVRLTAIDCSPVLRAWQTAAIIGRVHGLTPTSHEGLREVVVKEFEGLTYGGNDSWRLQKIIDIQNQWLRGQDPYASVAGGENYFGVKGRVEYFLQLVKQKYSDEDTVLVVSHGGLLRIALPLIEPSLSGIESDELVDHCKIIEVEYK